MASFFGSRYSAGLLVCLLCLGSCAGAGRQVQQPDGKAGIPYRAGALSLLGKALAGYTEGDYALAGILFDSLAALQPADSQLVFLGLYYGIRCRMRSGQPAEADSLYGAWQSRVPLSQRPELELVLGRAVPAGEESLAASAEKKLQARKIGAILPLSGKYSEFGEAILEGIKLALQEYNQGLPEDKAAALEIADDGGDAIRAATLGRRLAADSSLAGLIGSYDDECSLALALVASAGEIPLVCPTASAPSLSQLSHCVHIINRTDPGMAAELVRFAVNELGYHRFAVLAPDNDYGRLLAGTFERAVRASGATVVSDLRYGADTSNFENQMNLLRRYLPDALFLPTGSAEITQLAAQVHYFGLGQTRLLGNELWNNERVIRMGGEYVEGALFAASFYEDSDKLRFRSFAQAYESVFRRPVNRYSALGYDAASLFLQAAGEFPSSRALVNQRLNSVSGYKGAMGVYRIRESGLVEKEAFVLELSGGGVVPAVSPSRESGPSGSADTTGASPAQSP